MNVFRDLFYKGLFGLLALFFWVICIYAILDWDVMAILWFIVAFDISVVFIFV